MNFFQLLIAAIGSMLLTSVGVVANFTSPANSTAGGAPEAYYDAITWSGTNCEGLSYGLLNFGCTQDLYGGKPISPSHSIILSPY